MTADTLPLLLPDVPGKVHGTVCMDPVTVQCDGCAITLTWRDLLEPPSIDVMDCLFRMLEPHEIGAGMAFLPDYIVLGTKRQRVKQYGNAVTPPVSEVLISAIVECIQGHDIDWSAA